MTSDSWRHPIAGRIRIKHLPPYCQTASYYNLSPYARLLWSGRGQTFGPAHTEQRGALSTLSPAPPLMQQPGAPPGNTSRGGSAAAVMKRLQSASASEGFSLLLECA